MKSKEEIKTEIKVCKEIVAEAYLKGHGVLDRETVSYITDLESRIEGLEWVLKD